MSKNKYITKISKIQELSEEEKKVLETVTEKFVF